MKVKNLLFVLLALSLTIVSCEQKPVDEGDSNTTQPEPEPEPEPEPTPTPEDILFEANFSSGGYYGEMYSPGTDNYFISLSDNGFDDNGNVIPNTTYYRLDLYAPRHTGAWQEYMPLPVGVYHFDPEDTLAEWTFSADYSEYVTSDAAGFTTKLELESGVLTVTEDSTTLQVVIAGQSHFVTFTGEHEILNVTPKPEEDRELTLDYAYAVYYGDKFTPDTADNFYLYLSDKGLDEYGFEQAGGIYYAFDLYTECVEDMVLPYGTYAWDANDSLAAGTVSAYYTTYYSVNNEGTGYNDKIYPTEATVTVSADGIEAEVWFKDAKHILHFNGVPTIYEAPKDE